MQHGMAILQSTRGPFLLLTLACIFLGASLAVYNGAEPDGIKLTLIMVAALLAHASVNLLNEYSDFRSGLDLHTSRTPFSGGSGSLPAAPEAAISVRNAGILTLLGSVVIGIYLVLTAGPGLLLIGIIGVAVILTYTDWLNKSPLLCLLAPGLGFGLLMVPGTQFVLQQAVIPQTILAGLVVFCTTNNLLLLNQYPDRDADREAGRNHLIIAHGLRAGNTAYAAQLILIGLSILAGVLLGWLPTLTLISLLALPLSVFALSGAIRLGEALGSEPKYLASNVIVALLTPALLGLSLLFAA